ncbi:hypothetical protein ACWEJZ_01455 [Streptomyces bacillaris]
MSARPRNSRPADRRGHPSQQSFDEEEYGPFFEESAIAHRLLTEGEGSPWRHIPWR